MNYVFINSYVLRVKNIKMSLIFQLRVFFFFRFSRVLCTCTRYRVDDLFKSLTSKWFFIANYMQLYPAGNHFSKLFLLFIIVENDRRKKTENL